MNNRIISLLEENDDIFAADFFIIPPDDWQNSDVDSGDEELASINNLSRHDISYLQKLNFGAPDRLKLSK